jgi:hypothetical protein
VSKESTRRSTSPLRPETVVRIRRVLTLGSSFPSLVETASGDQWVMKLSGTGPGRRALTTEYLALKMARQLGLKVPEASLLDLPLDLPWEVGTDEFYEAVQRSTGLNLGIAFVADAVDLKAADLTSLPGDFLERLGAVDALLQNVDRTAANPNIIRDAPGVPWAIDFGACLLIDRLARGMIQPRLDPPPGHFLAGSNDAAISARALEMASTIDHGLLADAIHALPAVWLADLTLTHAALLCALRNYVESLAQYMRNTGDQGGKSQRQGCVGDGSGQRHR